MISILGADGKSYGPVEDEQVHRWLAEGRASLQTLARIEGSSEWLPLGEMRSFNPLLPPPLPARTPPPLPAAAQLLSVEEACALLATPNTELLASRLSRLVATLLDSTFSLFFALPGLFLLALGCLKDPTPFNTLMETGFPGHETARILIILGLLIPAIAQVWLLSTRGQTIGKALLQMRIVRDEDESKAGFIKAVVLRGLVPGLLGTLPYVGAFFTIANIFFIFRADKRCLHDHIAGTKVIRTDAEG